MDVSRWASNARQVNAERYLQVGDGDLYFSLFAVIIFRATMISLEVSSTVFVSIL